MMIGMIRELLMIYNRTELASKVGASEASVARWEKGAKPSRYFLKRISFIYKKSKEAKK